MDLNSGSVGWLPQAVAKQCVENLFVSFLEPVCVISRTFYWVPFVRVLERVCPKESLCNHCIEPSFGLFSKGSRTCFRQVLEPVLGSKILPVGF